MRKASLLLSLLLTLPAHGDDLQLVNLYDAFGHPRKGSVQDFGFSALVRYRGQTILFDAGTSADKLEQNARALGVDLREVDFAIASHAHADHTGGFDYLQRVNPGVKIYFPPDFFGAAAPLRFDIAGQEPEVVHELPPEQRYFSGRSTEANLASDGRFYKAVEYVDQTRQISPGVTLVLTHSPFVGYFTSYPNVDLQGNQVSAEEAKLLPLPELSLSLQSEQGEVLIVGCSHSTVEAIVEATRDTLGREVRAVAGGFHLLPYDRETIQGTAERLQALGVVEVAPAHCTGHLAFDVLRASFGDRYRFFGLGERLQPLEVDAPPAP